MSSIKRNKQELINSKKNKEESTSFKKMSNESVFNYFTQATLNQFWPNKLFFIFFVIENDQHASKLIDNLVEINKRYEDISTLSFITRTDILELLDTATDINFPKSLESVLSDIVQNVKDLPIENMPIEIEAQLIKLRLIEQLNQRYNKDIENNARNKSFENLLNDLSKECTKKQKQNGKNKVKDAKKKNVKNNKDEESLANYNVSALSDKDDISSGKIIFNHIWFYCITGVYSIEIMRYLVEQLNVPISVVIKIGKSSCNNYYDKISLFWDTLASTFFSNTQNSKCFENTVLMKFVPKVKNDILATFQELLYVIRNSVDVRLTHLKYIRNLTVQTMLNSYSVVPLECMRDYNKYLKYLPIEYVNHAVILDQLLNEVYFNLDNIKQILKSKTYMKENVPSTVSSAGSNRSSDLTSLLSTSRMDQMDIGDGDFLVHENNELQKISTFYKQRGYKILFANLNLLKLFPIFENIPTSVKDDIIHLHTKNPSAHCLITENQEVIDHFMYVFLFNSFYNETKKCKDFDDDDYGFIKNLITFDWEEYSKSVQPSAMDEINDINDSSFNLYDPSVIHYHWREKLPSDIILQELEKGLNEFSYLDWKYSPETDNFLLIFHDKLDEFGKHSKVFHEIVRTPICLRDFCRYTCINEAEWIRENRIETVKQTDEIVNKIELEETCLGSRNIKKNLKIFEEYLYLLDVNGYLDEENENQQTKETSQIESNFNEVLTNLYNYPCSKDLLNECEKSIGTHTLLSYDMGMGNNLFTLTGHQTKFCSHDGIKVLIDNTGFLQESPKCSVKLSFNGNYLTAYSSEKLIKQIYIVNLILEDETRISFLLNGIKIQNEFQVPEREEEKSEEIKHNVLDEIVQEKYKQNIELVKDIKETLEDAEEQVVHCIDEDQFKDLFGDGHSCSDYMINEDVYDLADAMLNSTENNGTVFKIRPTFHHLKNINSNAKIPLQYILQNILSQLKVDSAERHEKHTMRYGLSENEGINSLDWPLDFRLCLPNGLFTRVYPVNVDDGTYIIKQEYTDARPQVIRDEEFRLWSSLGLVLIKRTDATIRILKSNGEIIDFENDLLEQQSDGPSKHQCLSILENYKTRYSRMLRKEQQDLDLVLSSKQIHELTQPVQILEQRILRMMEQLDLPYSKTILTSFDGKKIQLHNKKLTYIQAYFLTTLQDYSGNQTLFERTDGFRSNLDKHGTQQVFFSDGTQIETCFKVVDELVDGFVFVNLITRYDHPYYLSVKFESNGNFELILKNGTVLKRHQDRKDYLVEIDTGVSLMMSEKEVNLRKICSNCKGHCWCKIDVSSFYEGVWKPEKIFVDIEDTYNKRFYSDFLGNCYVNTDYLSGALNKFKCNHAKETVYKKLFVVNKNLSGEVFWTNEQIENKIKQTKEDSYSTFKSYRKISDPNITTADCRKKYYETYPDRFYNKNLLDNFTYIPKVAYCTFRVFNQMFHSVEEVKEHVLKLRSLFFLKHLESYDTDNLYKNIAKLSNDIEIYEELCNGERDTNLEYKAKKCECTKQSIMAIDKKIERWKMEMKKHKNLIQNPNIPSYFQSDFCKITE